ncbi:MAG: hypothetical protein JWQ42_2353 [Edaphobacter sp.]|nr:hypothetical protein [Edaphobacter sp.]
MFGRIFFDLGAAFTLMTVVVHIRLYRKYSSGKRIPASSKEAYEFVEHSCFSLWLSLGVILIPMIDLSPWWLIAWFLLGGLATFIVERLVVIGGLGAFITAGEHFLQPTAEARAAEMDFINEVINEVPDYPPNPPGVERFF